MKNKEQQNLEPQYQEDLLSTLTEDRDVVGSWYRAREFAEEKLVEKLCRMNVQGKFTDSLHIIVEGTSPLMCAVIREIILRAHYYDFNEETRENASLITVHCDNEETTKNILLSTPFLGDYLRYCWGADGKESLYFLDVLVEVRTEIDEDKNAVVLTDEDLDAFCDGRNVAHTIDTKRARLANQAYNMGRVLDNLPDINSADVKMYNIPRTDFEAKLLSENVGKKWEDADVMDKLSNVFCVDTFDLRIKMLERSAFETEEYKDITLLSKKDFETLTCKVEENILALSKCEHSRWVAEKLLLGFKPWSPEDHYKYSRMFGKEKKDYRGRKKSEGFHYDICSYRDLCRCDPGNRKYDTFLVLSMLNIDKKK